ncbi:hypothetical protein [Gaoshiqia sediminis]|uniref:Porin n=1 Tax=Gaoshiqia sediminis TaxID=2986998 RepID=A0AA41Y4A3_9BACT|nr:hypothetical protein [Gaoshiqia sediminis]MCW0483201.1 hypothetical protein [Gaoshiqia sediminis]
MRYILFILACLIFSTAFSQAETGQEKGKPIVQIFGNFDVDATKNAQKQYGFWFGRAHLGYEYQFSPQFLGRIILDAGRPTTVGQISVADRTGNEMDVSNSLKEGSYYTVTLKFASLEWKPTEQIKIQAGGILQNHYITQERFWGYRYLAATFQDRYFGIPSGDLGLIGYFKLNSTVGFDAALTNGEGFRMDQDAYGDVKFAGGVDFFPVKEIQTRFYYDHTSSESPEKSGVQQLISFFAGYKPGTKFRIGGEYNYRFNHQHLENRDLFGISIYGSLAVKHGWELFARVDRLDANIIHNDPSSDLGVRSRTGEALIAGVHFSPVKGVNLSLNYQGWNPDERSLSEQHHLLLSFEYKL